MNAYFIAEVIFEPFTLRRDFCTFIGFFSANERETVLFGRTEPGKKTLAEFII